MNLMSGNSYWLDTLPTPPNYPSLEEDVDCDVVVIGGGVTGAIMSYELQQAGMDAILVDKRPIGHGSTSASTGLLQFANDKHLTSFINTFGTSDGVRFYRLCKAAIDRLENICAKLEIDPQFRRRDSLYYASCIEDMHHLKLEFDALKQHGFNVDFLNAAQIQQLFKFKKQGAIYSRGDADINAYRLTHSLLRTSQSTGLRVFENTEIVSHHTKSDRIEFHTRNHKRIRCHKAVFATGYEAQQMKKNANAILSSTYVAATQPIVNFTPWYNDCLIWETARPYTYIRTTVDHRIIIGGLDETTIMVDKRDAMLIHKRDLLIQSIQQLFPELSGLRAEYWWSATFGSTHDGLPLIGAQEDDPNCFFALGYGGNGIVYSMIAAEIITNLIVKGTHPDANLVKFNR